MTAQDGIVCQAGTPEGWVSAREVRGRWVAASSAGLAPCRCCRATARPFKRQHPATSRGIPSAHPGGGSTLARGGRRWCGLRHGRGGQLEGMGLMWAHCLPLGISDVGRLRGTGWPGAGLSRRLVVRDGMSGVQLAATMTRLGGVRRGVDQRRDGRVAADLVQAAATVGPMLPTGIASVALISAYGTGGSAVSMATSRWHSVEMGVRLAQRRMALGREHFLLGEVDLLIRDFLGVERVDGCVRSACRAHETPALPPGGGSEPSGQRGQLANLAQLIHQLQPDGLAHVVGVGAVEPVLAANRPDQRGVPLDECVPRLCVAVPGARHQVDDYRVIKRLVNVSSGAGPQGA